MICSTQGRMCKILLWLLSFLGMVLGVLATAIRRHWQPAFVASVVAALATLATVLTMPSVWIDLVAVAIVWVIVVRALFSHAPGDARS